MSKVIKPKLKRRQSKKQTRLPHQKKQTCKGIKSHRGKPEIYDELKKIVSFSLTPTAIAELDQFGQQLGISRSEFVERIARGVIQITIPGAIS